MPVFVCFQEVNRLYPASMQWYSMQRLIGSFRSIIILQPLPSKLRAFLDFRISIWILDNFLPHFCVCFNALRITFFIYIQFEYFFLKNLLLLHLSLHFKNYRGWSGQEKRKTVPIMFLSSAVISDQSWNEVTFYCDIHILTFILIPMSFMNTWRQEDCSAQVSACVYLPYNPPNKAYLRPASNLCLDST